MLSCKLLICLLWQVASLETSQGKSRQPWEQPSALHSFTEFIFVSQPGEHSVSVTEVNALTRKVMRESRPFITAGLHEPTGLAVDHKRQRLYVADPKSHKVFMYKLYFGVNGLAVRQDQQFVAVRDVTPRWIAVDEKGTLFCTDEGRSFIAEVSAKELADLGREDVKYDQVRPTWHKLYSGDQDEAVDHPGGIAVDGTSIFWGNRKRGHPHGSLLQASEDPEEKLARGVPEMIKALSSNMDKVYGVCNSPTMVFYTGGARQVYGAKPGSFQARASETVLLNDFAQPRGCVWDGDGTVYLADKGADAVWSFPSSMHNTGLVQATKAFSVTDPYGVAVFRPSFSVDAVGFLRGAAVQAKLALAPMLLMMLGVLGCNA